MFKKKAKEPEIGEKDVYVGPHPESTDAKAAHLIEALRHLKKGGFLDTATIDELMELVRPGSTTA